MFIMISISITLGDSFAPGPNIKTLVDHSEQVAVLEGGGDPLLVRQLFVDRGLRGVSAGADADAHLPSVRKRPEQLHSYCKTFTNKE